SPAWPPQRRPRPDPVLPGRTGVHLLGHAVGKLVFAPRRVPGRPLRRQPVLGRRPGVGPGQAVRRQRRHADARSGAFGLLRQPSARRPADPETAAWRLTLPLLRGASSPPMAATTRWSWPAAPRASAFHAGRNPAPPSATTCLSGPRAIPKASLKASRRDAICFTA